MNVVAQDKSKMRIDITGPLSIQLATLSMQNQDVICILPQQKKYITATDVNQMMKSLLKVEMSREFLYRLIYDESFNGIETKGFQVNWIERKDDIRKVSLGNELYELQIAFIGLPTKVELDERMFQIEPKSSYTQQVLK